MQMSLMHLAHHDARRVERRRSLRPTVRQLKPLRAAR
jgi:hypothetical protein